MFFSPVGEIRQHKLYGGENEILGSICFCGGKLPCGAGERERENGSFLYGGEFGEASLGGITENGRASSLLYGLVFWRTQENWFYCCFTILYRSFITVYDLVHGDLRID